MKQKRDSKRKIKLTGPGEDCKCPVCVFTKSQAPGDPYDLTKCPKYSGERRNAQDKLPKTKDG